MYFDGEERNASDGLFKQHSENGRKTVLAKPMSATGDHEKDALVMGWDIVLAFG